MNLAEQIRIALTSVEDKGDFDKTICEMTNVVIRILCGNGYITVEESLAMQIPVANTFDMRSYGELWSLLGYIDPTINVALRSINRKDEEE